MSEPEAPPIVQKKGDWLATIATAGEAPTALSPIAFEPTDLPSLVKVAELFSRSNLVPEDLRGKPDDVLLVLWTGREYGFGAIGALKNIHVIKGRTSFSADSLHAMVVRSGLCGTFYLVESTDERATYATHRLGNHEPTSLTYTLQQAKQAGLLSKSTWQAHPAAMLRNAAKRLLVRAVYGDVIAGLHTPDELDSPGVIDILPEPAPAAEPKADKLARNAREKRQAAAPVAPAPETVVLIDPGPTQSSALQAQMAGRAAGRNAAVALEVQAVLEDEAIDVQPAMEGLKASVAAPVEPSAPAQESLLDRAKRPYYRTPDFVEALEARAELAGISKNELAAECLKTYGLTPRELPDPKWKELTSWVEKRVARAEEPQPMITPDHLAKIIAYAGLCNFGAPEDPTVALRRFSVEKMQAKLEDLTTEQGKKLVQLMTGGAA